MRSIPLHVSVLALALLSAPVLAQTTPLNLPKVIANACGLQVLDGSLWAGGPAYKAEFRPDALEFTPALGKQAPHNFPLRLTLAAVGRGEELQPVGSVAPRQQGLRVSYPHAACELRYDVTPAGLEQSVVFEALPAGAGDLRIRLAVETALTQVPTDAGLRFELAGVGGVSIGAVTGIDASGARCAGAITCSGGVVELSLPAAFVQRAALPLVVDPLVGTFAVTATTLDYQAPDMAGCPSIPSNVAFVVFERVLSATDRDIRGLELFDDGSPTASLVLLTTSSALDSEPAVGVRRVSDRWVVVYQRGGGLMARSLVVNAGAVVGPEITVVATADSIGAPDVGSEFTQFGSDVLCVYRNETQDRIQAQRIACTSTGVLSASAPVTLATAATTTDFGRPRISHDGGLVGNYLIVYPRSPQFGGTQLQGVVVDLNLAVLATAALTTDSTQDHDNPAVDGDGVDWVVAIEQKPALTAGDTDIRALPVGFSATSGQVVVGTSVGVASIAGINETAPAVTFVGTTCLVAWLRPPTAGSFDTNVYCRTVEPFTCSVCEVTALVANTADIERNLTLARMGFPQGASPALLLWETSEPLTGNGDINGATFRPGDGSLASPGAGCGAGGFVRPSCARVGNASFQVRLRTAQPAATAWLVLAPGIVQALVQIGCGPCQLRADLWSGVLFAGVATDAQGNAQQAIPIPNVSALTDLDLVAQWIVGTPAGLCTALNADFSTWLRFRLD